MYSMSSTLSLRRLHPCKRAFKARRASAEELLVERCAFSSVRLLSAFLTSRESSLPRLGATLRKLGFFGSTARCQPQSTISVRFFPFYVVTPKEYVMDTSYEKEMMEWASEEDALLRAGKLTAIDVEHIAEEIEDVGR